VGAAINLVEPQSVQIQSRLETFGNRQFAFSQNTEIISKNVEQYSADIQFLLRKRGFHHLHQHPQ